MTNKFSSGAVPASILLMSVYGIMFEKKCSSSQKTNVIVILNNLTDQQTQ